MPNLHERDIVFKNGLVDPTSLLEYMDGCRCADLLQANPAKGHREEYHHLVFKKEDYKGKRVSLIFRRLRNSKNSQIEMLSCQEDLYHQMSAETVPKYELDIDAAKEFLEEDAALMEYAAASWLRSRTETFLESGRNLSRLDRDRSVGWLALLEEMQAEGAQKVQAIRFIAPEVVNGALHKYLLQQPDAGMQALAGERLETNPALLLPRIYDANSLRVNAEDDLRGRIRRENWATQRVLAIPAIGVA